MKHNRVSGSVTPLILNLDAIWRKRSSSRPGLFTHGKKPMYFWSRRLGGPQRRSGCFRRKENSFTFTWIQTRGRPAHSLITITTTLSRLYIQGVYGKRNRTVDRAGSLSCRLHHPWDLFLWPQYK
jgi:hypothetical protein